jgi:hypothetical protein
MNILVNFQSNWRRDGLCTVCKYQKGQFMRNDLGTSKSWKCVQGWQAPHEAIQKLCSNMSHYVCNVLGIMIMLMATFGQAVLGP